MASVPALSSLATAQEATPVGLWKNIDGKVWRCKLTLAAGGKQLNVRGYIGVPLFGRSQTWVRQD